MDTMTWGQRFAIWDAANPKAYQLFKKFTLDVLRAGHKRIGYIGIIGRIRYETMLETTGDPFKINQNFAPYLARKFTTEFPQHEGIFSYKTLRS